MASGITLAMNRMYFAPTQPLPAGPSRDRSLHGKARIKARRAANRKAKA